MQVDAAKEELSSIYGILIRNVGVNCAFNNLDWVFFSITVGGVNPPSYIFIEIKGVSPYCMLCKITIPMSEFSYVRCANKESILVEIKIRIVRCL